MATLKLKLRKTKHIYPGRPSEMGYVARVVSNGTADYATIAEDAAEDTTFNVDEIRAAGGIFCRAAAKLLKQGYIVDLGPIGKLYPSCSSPWHSDASALRISEVKATVNYRPSDDIQAAIAGASLTWAKGEAAEDDDSGDDSGSGGGVSGWGDPGDITE